MKIFNVNSREFIVYCQDIFFITKRTFSLSVRYGVPRYLLAYLRKVNTNPALNDIFTTLIILALNRWLRVLILDQLCQQCTVCRGTGIISLTYNNVNIFGFYCWGYFYFRRITLCFIFATIISEPKTEKLLPTIKRELRPRPLDDNPEEFLPF